MATQVKKLIVVLIALLLVVVTLFLVNSKRDFADRPTSFTDLGGDFELRSANGPVALSDFYGKAVVLYFGFLSCPEVCPNSLGVIQTAFNQLSTEELNKTQAILISVDPQRDTLDKLAEYARFYHPKLIGVTGSQQQLNKVSRQYGAYFDLSDVARANEDYLLEHSSRYYVINPQGQLVAAMRHSTTPNELRAQVRAVL